jgi:hypothetical protein
MALPKPLHAALVEWLEKEEQRLDRLQFKKYQEAGREGWITDKGRLAAGESSIAWHERQAIRETLDIIRARYKP